MTAGVVKVMAYRSPSGTAMHRGLQPVGAPREQVELPFVRASPPVWALLFFCQQAFSWLLFYWPAFQPALLRTCACRFGSFSCAGMSLSTPFVKNGSSTHGGAVS